jgi:uroporphyrinogen-III synthase
MSEKPRILYLGTTPEHYQVEGNIVHCKMIDIVPRDFQSFDIKHQMEDILKYTHVILTSQHAVTFLIDLLHVYGYCAECLKGKQCLVIGESTANALRKAGIQSMLIAKEATQEGVMDLLDLLDLEKAYLFYPRSSRARPTLSYYLRVRQLRHQICDLYDTKTALLSQLPSLEEFDEVVFTSPSTVEAFFEQYEVVPAHLKLKAIGPVTQASLEPHRFLVEEK